jgi:hypothetical protein
MELAEVGRAVLKHKFIAGTLLAATVAGSVAGFVKTPTTYQTEASLVVLAPTKQVSTAPSPAGNAGGVQTVNPFLSFGGSQETAAQVLMVRMSDDEVANELDGLGVNSQWKFEVKGGSGPVINVTATGATPDKALASAQHIVDTAMDQLTKLQNDAGSPQDQLIKASEVTTPSVPTRVYDTNLRVAVLIAALGLLLTIGIPNAIEGVKRGRARRGDPDAGSGESDVADDDATVDREARRHSRRDEPEKIDEPVGYDESEEPEAPDEPEERELVASSRYASTPLTLDELTQADDDFDHRQIDVERIDDEIDDEVDDERVDQPVSFSMFSDRARTEQLGERDDAVESDDVTIQVDELEQELDVSALAEHVRGRTGDREASRDSMERRLEAASRRFAS